MFALFAFGSCNVCRHRILNLKFWTLSSKTEQLTTKNTIKLGFENFSVFGLQNLQARGGENQMIKKKH